MKIKKEKLQELKKIEVLEYSESQRCEHKHSLYNHMVSNVNNPCTDYVIVEILEGDIPQWLYESKFLLSLVRIPESLDRSKSLINDLEELF